MDKYEKEMFDGVNRHAGEKVQYPTTHDKQSAQTDARSLWLGLKRVLVALLTAASFGLTGYTFFAVATATGYWAVALFIAAIVLAIWSFSLLYAQGIVPVESQGDGEC